MRFIQLLIGLFLFFLSCSYPEKDPGNTGERQIIIDSISNVKYRNDSIMNVWIDSYLKNINEPDLKYATTESFRFILWQAFKPSYILFRIQKHANDSISLTTKYFELKEPDGRGTDSVIAEFNTTLTIDDWDKVVNKSLESYFWTLEPTDNPSRHLTDGSYLDN